MYKYYVLWFDHAGNRTKTFQIETIMLTITVPSVYDLYDFIRKKQMMHTSLTFETDSEIKFMDSSGKFNHS
jgi:hypothetical protein